MNYGILETIHHDENGLEIRKNNPVDFDNDNEFIEWFKSFMIVGNRVSYSKNNNKVFYSFQEGEFWIFHSKLFLNDRWHG